MEILRGTRWDVTGEPWAKNLYNIAFNAFLGPLWKGRVPISFRGRVMVRKGAGTFGSGTLYKLTKLAGIGPPDVSRQLRERIKHHAQALVSAGVKVRKVSGESIIGIQRMNQIMDSDSITARPGSYTPKVYHNGDRAIIKSENFGKAPADASYDYVLLPGRTQSEVAAYANNPPFEVLKNTATVQAVRNKNQYAGNFWKAGSAGEMTTHQPASVVLQIERDAGSGDYPDKLQGGISDPTQKQKKVRIEIDCDVDRSSMTDGQAQVEDDTDRLSVVESGGPLVLEVDASGSHGDTITATFNAKF